MKNSLNVFRGCRIFYCELERPVTEFFGSGTANKANAM